MLGKQPLYTKAFDTSTPRSCCFWCRISLAMDRGGVSMDAGKDVWDWEVLHDHMRSSMCHDNTNLADDQETKEPIILPPSCDVDVHDEPVDQRKDLGVVLDETEPSKEEAMAEVTDDPPASDWEEGEKKFQSTDTKKADDGKFDEEEEEDAIKKDNGQERPECVVFSVGKLKVSGVGALCSFGVAAAATVCIFLIGGKLQYHHRQQQQQHQQKIQLQFYGDDKVVQQTSRLNQAMSSVMGGGASTRANISFGGFFDGF